MAAATAVRVETSSNRASCATAAESRLACPAGPRGAPAVPSWATTRIAPRRAPRGLSLVVLARRWGATPDSPGQPRGRNTPVGRQSAGVAIASPAHGADLGWSRDLGEKVCVLRSQILGEGTSGVVVLGVEKATGRHVAVKILQKGSRRAAARIAGEVNLLERLQGSPNIIQLVGKFEDDECAYVITELCNEGDLGYLTESVELSECEAAVIARDLLTVLAECHSNNIAHCDIKPENFMVSLNAEGQRSIKAVDFGCSQVVKGGTPLREKTGTPLYRAPEMYLRQYGLEADLWAAGMIIYQLLCGKLCFLDCLEDCTPQSVMDAVLKDEISFKCPGWSEVSEEAKDLVSLLMKREPTERLSAENALHHPWIVANCGVPEVYANNVLAGAPLSAKCVTTTAAT